MTTFARKNTLPIVIIFALSLALNANAPSPIKKTFLPEDAIVFHVKDCLLRHTSKKNIYYTSFELTIIEIDSIKCITQQEINKYFPDSTCTKDVNIKNDSWKKNHLFIPISRNRWCLKEVETLISGSSSRYSTDNNYKSFIFDRIGSPQAGFVRIKGTNIYVIMPFN